MAKFTIDTANKVESIKSYRDARRAEGMPQDLYDCKKAIDEIWETEAVQVFQPGNERARLIMEREHLARRIARINLHLLNDHGDMYLDKEA